MSIAVQLTASSEEPRQPRTVGYQLVLITLLSLNYGVVFFDRNALSFLMPFIQPDLALTGVEIGMLVSALSLTWSTSAYGLGRLSDRLGTRKGLLIVATLIFSSSSWLLGLAGSFASLLLLRMLMGMSEGGIMPISQAMTADAVPARHRGLAMGIMQNFGSSLLGSFVAPIVLVAVAEHYGWRQAFMLSAVPGVFFALLIGLFVDRDPPIRRESKRVAASVRQVLRNRNIILCALIAILNVAFFLAAMAFLPLFLVQVGGYRPSTMSWLIAVLGVSSTVNAVFLSALADRVGRKPLMIAGSLLGLLVPAGALIHGLGVGWLVVMLLVGWAPIALFPLFMATIPSESVDPLHAATAIGLTMAMGELIGGVFAPVLTGALADRFGLQAALWTLVGLCVLAALLSLGLRETAPRKLARIVA